MNYLKAMLSGAVMCLLLARAMGASADTTNVAPDFKEVYDLVRAHLAGATEQDLDQVAAKGLLSELHGKVSLTPASDTNADSTTPILGKPVFYDGGIVYLRVGRVGEGLAGMIKSACGQLTNGLLQGVIVDLRYAGGHDYAAVAPVVDMFVAQELPLLDWGEGVVRSKAKTDALNVPVAVLANQRTSAAAEALAAVMREAGHALILGTDSAGEATVDQEFTLKSGQHLRIATAAIKLGNGDTLTTKGVAPDIKVEVDPSDAAAYYADPYKEIQRSTSLAAGLGSSSRRPGPQTATNRPPHSVRPTEADLIKERKERPGMELEYTFAGSREPESDKPYIRDPVLGRALDLVRGISALRPQKAP